MRFALYVSALFAWACAEHVSYDGWKVFRMVVTNEQDCKTLIDLATNPSVDFWSDVIMNKFIDVMVKNDYQDEFTSLLEEHKIRYKILINDLEPVLRQERLENEQAPRSKDAMSGLEQYQTGDELYKFIDRHVVNFPQIINVSTIGETHEKRPIKLIKFTLDDKKKKPIIFIDGAMHGREWTGPAVIKYFMFHVLFNSKNRFLLNKVDWYIIPVANPDGYDYSHKHDQLWRKNRSPQLNTSCVGVDINRNFGYKWGLRGSTRNPCSNTYMGPSAFSEKESTVISKCIESLKDRIKLYISLHSYGSFVIIPWAESCRVPHNYIELRILAEFFNRSVVKAGSEPYNIGSFGDYKYFASGVSTDWAMAEADVPLTYTIELPKGGTSGFNPPVKQLLRIGHSTFEGLKAFGKYIAHRFG